MTGATTELPDKVDPSVGFTLKYFTGRDGFARPMCPLQGEGVVWLFGLVVLPDDTGRERTLAFFQRRRGVGAVLEYGFVVYNDEKETFEKLKTVPLDPVIFPQLYPTRVNREGIEYLYFNMPYPVVRVKADWKSYLDLSAYESYTCLKPGTRPIAEGGAQLDRDANFYNPTQHPFLDRQGGRMIYLEGSYANTFSGNPHPTPHYEYNQIMYRLDLSDLRLRLPEVVDAGR